MGIGIILNKVRQSLFLQSIWFKALVSVFAIIILSFCSLVSLRAMGTIDRLPWEKTKIGPAIDEPTTDTESDKNKNSNSEGGTSTSDSDTSSNIFGDYSATSIENIVGLLPLVYDDATSDWTIPNRGGPPSGVFHYGPVDLDNLYAAVKDGRLYIKRTLGGALSTSRETIDDNTIESVTHNIKIRVNNQSNNNCRGTSAFLQVRISYEEDGQIWYNPWFNSVCTNSGPYQSDHDWTFQYEGKGLVHTFNSGIGKNSIDYSFALSDLGDIFSVGDKIQIQVYSEAESNNYEHYSLDSDESWQIWTVAEI